ncbi:hypothetical protein [Nocardia fluminea]|uniref:hypothetical protein n=1 Tax=Nocardia fluminea TaxID=134984 RepID=UPI003D0B9B9A
MARTKNDGAAEELHRELVEAFGEDWSIDDFPPDPLPEPGTPPSVVSGPQQLLGALSSSVRPDTRFVSIEVGPELAVRAQHYTYKRERAEDSTVQQPVQLSLSMATLVKLQQRAEAAGTSIDELVSEWVTAEANADGTISRDELLALLARRQSRSA